MILNLIFVLVLLKVQAWSVKTVGDSVVVLLDTDIEVTSAFKDPNSPY